MLTAAGTVAAASELKLLAGSGVVPLETLPKTLVGAEAFAKVEAVVEMRLLVVVVVVGGVK